MPAGQPLFYYVDATEEIAGVLRGIKQAKAARVAIVLPKEPRLFRNDVNLRLIAAYAREGGKEVALITPDMAVARIAGVHGLRVYSSPDLAWQPEGRVICNDITEPYRMVEGRLPGNKAAATSGGPVHRRQRVVVLAIALLAAVGLLYAFTPRVTVVVTPALHMLERQIQVALSTNPAENGVLVRTGSVTITVTGSSPATGRRVVGVDAADGSVLFFNDSNRAVGVPKGTIVTTDGGQSFATTTAVQVPPVKPEYFMSVPVGMKAGQAEAPIKAVKPGSAGNVAAGRIKILPNGPAGIRVINPEPTRGGTDRSVVYVTQSDADAAQAQAVGKLKTQAEKSLAAKVGSDAYIFRTMMSVKTGQFSNDPAVGTEADQVTVTMAADAVVPYVLRHDIQKAVAALTDAQVPAGYQRLGAPEIAAIDAAAPTATGQAPDSLVIQAKIPVGDKIDPAEVAKEIAGLTPEQARKALVDSGEVGEATVRGRVPNYLPGWTPWIKVVVADSTGNKRD